MSRPLKEVRFEVKWNALTDVPIVGPFYTLMTYANEVEEEVRKCQLTVYLQGNLEAASPLGEMKQHLVVLTVHDVGTNPPNSFVKFVNSPAMAEFDKNAVFLHVCVPGQEPNAADFSGDFPSMNQIASFLPQVLGHFGLTHCVALGEGAGADAVCRFALNSPDLVRGLVLIHCTSTTHGFIENLKEIFANLRIGEGKMSDTAWDYLMAHKFGEHHDKQSRKCFIEKTRALGLNEHNLSCYLHAFGNREDFTNLLELYSSKLDAILVTGGKSPHNKNIFHMFEHMDKGKTGLIVAESVVDLLEEAPEYLVHTLNSLCQRHFTTLDTAPAVEEAGEKQKANGQSTPLARKADHPGQPPILASAKAPLRVPQEKPSLLVTGQQQAIPQKPEELLPGHYDPPNGAALPQNPDDFLPDRLILPPISKCDSSLSQISNFQCPHCGKECCWCEDLMPGPGSPLE